MLGQRSVDIRTPCTGRCLNIDAVTGKEAVPILHGALSPILASGLLARAVATSSVCSVYPGAEGARGYRGFRILCAGRCSRVV